MIYINILLIALIFTIGTDVLNFWDEISSRLNRIISKGRFTKPLSIKIMQCSTCQTFWMSMLYILIIKQLTILNIAYILTIAMLTPEINSVIILLKSLINKALNKIMNEIDS